MKIIIYSDNEVIEVIEGIEEPVVDDNNISWVTGRIDGLQLPFLIVEDDVSTDLTISELVDLDLKDNFKSEQSEIEKLREENKMNAVAIMELASLLMSGG